MPVAMVLFLLGGKSVADSYYFSKWEGPLRLEEGT